MMTAEELETLKQEQKQAIKGGNIRDAKRRKNEQESEKSAFC